MNFYIKAFIAFIIFLGVSFHTGFSYISAANNVTPTTHGPDALVDVIKKYSDITEADVDKYKLLWLGWFGIVPSLAFGGYSVYKAAQGAEYAFGPVSTQLAALPSLSSLPVPSLSLSSLPPLSSLSVPGVSTENLGLSAEAMVNFFKTPTPWKTMAALGAGFISYKLLYPRIRQGVLSKVENFLNLCANLTVAKQSVFYITDIAEWRDAELVAVCRALENLTQQARLAGLLLNQVGATDSEVIKLKNRLYQYSIVLMNNQGHWSDYCKRFVVEQKNEIRENLQHQGLESQVFGQKIQNVKSVISIVQKVGSGIFNFARDVANFGIANKEPLGVLGAGYWLYKKIYP